MTILVTGATGNIGRLVLDRLVQANVEIRALTRSPEKARLPERVSPVSGELGDVDSIRAALGGVSTLFLLAANAPDELSQAMITLNLAKEAGVRRLVYLSVFKSVEYANVPHFASKRAVEQMIEASDIGATILRPAYFIQNDLRLKAGLLGAGVYGMPVGEKGISMVDTRDIADVAASQLLLRHGTTSVLPTEIVELVGPDVLSGARLAQLWSEVLNRPVRYGGDDLQALEQRMRAFAPAWSAYDLRLMMARYQDDGAVATSDDLARLTRHLGRAPRSYRDFAVEAAAAWAADKS
jgi:uncharacterized protein YbjT (DUF2867 family)